MCEDTGEGVPCRNYECKHNLFYRGLRLGSRFTETALAVSLGNCDKNITRRCKLREIADMWGMTRERVRQIQNVAVLHFIQGVKKEVEKNG